MKRQKIKDISADIAEVSKKPIPEIIFDLVPTGCDILDCIIMGGIPIGRMLNIIGDSSSGKTFLAIETIANALKKWLPTQKKYKKIKWCYDDVENGFSFDTESMYGFEMIGEDQEGSESIEEFALNLKKQSENIAKDELLIYVLDSLDGISSKAERKRDEKMMDDLEKGKKIDGSYQLEKQKFMSSFFRLRTKEIKNKNVILIIISQVRYRIGFEMGPKYFRTGGKAMDFFAYACIWLATTDKIIKKKRQIGVTIKALAKKAKIPRPFREGFINIVFDYGIDNITTNVRFLYDLWTDLGKAKKAESVKWDGETYKVKKLVKFIEDNDLEDELTRRVKEKWEMIENSIASKRKNKWQ